MKTAIIVFPETNCDVETFRACELLGWAPEYVTSTAEALDGFDMVILPAASSSLEFIQTARLAVYTPIIEAIKHFVDKKQGIVMGICIGFQILCEIGLLPGSIEKNDSAKYICDDVELILSEHGVQRRVVLPIACLEGKYVVNAKGLNKLNEEGMIFLTYIKNPNGSVGDIAGIIDKNKNIIGLIPCPEKAVSKEFGFDRGRLIFSIAECLYNDLKGKR